jgi:hypothetical protein
VPATKEYIAARLNVITAEKCRLLRLLATASNDADAADSREGDEIFSNKRKPP